MPTMTLTNNTPAKSINTGNEIMTQQVYVITADGGNIAVCRYYEDACSTARYWRTRKGLRNVRINMRPVF